MIHRRPTLPCLGYRIETDWGTEYDCEYGSGIFCEECLARGGSKDPRTGKPYRRKLVMRRIRARKMKE